MYILEPERRRGVYQDSDSDWPAIVAHVQEKETTSFAVQKSAPVQASLLLTSYAFLVCPFLVMIITTFVFVIGRVPTTGAQQPQVAELAVLCQVMAVQLPEMVVL